MYNIIYDSVELRCPLKRIRIHDNTPAWFTKELIELINTKREIMARILKHNRKEDHLLL